MITSGFTNAPVARFLVFGTVVLSFTASLTDTRYYAYIMVVPHIWEYGQFWRFLTWQVCLRSSAGYQHYMGTNINYLC